MLGSSSQHPREDVDTDMGTGSSVEVDSGRVTDLAAVPSSSSFVVPVRSVDCTL